MRFYLIIQILLSSIFAKDISYKIQATNNQAQNLISINGTVNQDNIGNSTRSMREDTTTIWLQDFEGDLSDWSFEEGWELTEDS